MPIVTRKSYNKSIIVIPRVGQYGEIYSVLDLGIVPPFSRADTVNLEQNIPPYFPPSHAIYHCKSNSTYLIVTIINGYNIYMSSITSVLIDFDSNRSILMIFIVIDDITFQ